MSTELQNMIIIAICFLAVAYLVFHLLKKKKEKSACCNCPAMKITQQKKDK